jgi:hypothetical protein
MILNLGSWDTTITDMTVDELKRKVVVRASYLIVAKEAQVQVENDLLWMLEMDEEGRKIRKSVEFIDGIAAARLKEITMNTNSKQRYESVDIDFARLKTCSV